MNETLLALLSSLAIYGLASFAMPHGNRGANDTDISVAREDTVDRPPASDLPDDGTHII